MEGQAADHADAIAAWETGTSYTFGIVRVGPFRDIVGLVTLFRGDISRPSAVCDIGYAIDGEHCGCGFATEAVRLALDVALAELDQEAVYAGVQPHNAASVRVLEKVGFRHVHDVPTYAGIPRPHSIFLYERELR